MAITTDNILGQGLVAPLRRQGSDFTSAKGSALVESAVKQIIRTRKGDLRWRPNFGLGTLKMLHKPITDVYMAQVQADVAGSLTQYDPRIEIVDLVVERGGGNNSYPEESIIIHVRWRAVVRNRNKRNTVLTDVQSTEVVI